MIGGCGFVAIQNVAAALLILRFNRLAGTWQQTELVMATVKKISSIDGTVTFAVDDGEHRWTDKNRISAANLVYLSLKDDIVLAARIAGSNNVILIDENLSVLDFTEMERNAIRRTLAS